MTLEDVIEALRARSTGWSKSPPSLPHYRQPEGHQALTPLLVPFGQDAAFVALEPGRGLSDLALGVVDRLEEPGVDSPERPFWSFGIAWSRCMRS